VFLGGILVLASGTSGSVNLGGRQIGEHLWSPYYRVDYFYAPARKIAVNLIGHQSMSSTGDSPTRALAYSLPYLLERDSGGPPFENALVIGAGSGNDVSRALQWNVRHIDAVEIDPVILRLGKRDHPDRPYQDSRVTTYSDDGRNFLRATDRQYDLIIYALVDSLVLHSSYSDLRLESFLFTREALADVRRHLKPGGLFFMYNYFRQGWIVGRLDKELSSAFGSEPLVFTLPYRDTVEPETSGGFTMLVSGNTDRLREVFARHSHFWLSLDQPHSPASPNGFDLQPSPEEQSHLMVFGPARVVQPEALTTATDDWPFLYVGKRMIPSLGLRGIGTMGGLALLLLWLFMRKQPDSERRWRIDGRMFFLGAGFLLLETEAVVHMALLFGSTWMVNTVVFLAVLVMILAANLFVLKFRPQRLWPYYAGLLAALALNIVIPLDYFLGMNRGLQIAASCLLVFAPVLFAGVIFAAAFGRSTEPDRDFGANVGGAILGGLAEYSSTLLGFQYLTALAVVFYVLSAALARKPTNALPA
jgi:spermidine synthase/drug/metabolite transporter (DMT)-like permease